MSLIEIKNLTFSYDGSYENVFENVSFNIDTNWKLGLIGKNGKGKTTFLKLMAGKLKYFGYINKNVNCDYFPFEVSDEDMYVIDIINTIVPNVEEWKIKKEFSLIKLDSNIMYSIYKYISGGEKVKVLLVSLFLRENDFLLIDEPTNHLDYEAKVEVERYLKSKQGFIIVSHDRELLDNVVDHIISINNNSIQIQSGNYSSWKENKQRIDKFELNKNERLKKDIKRLEVSQKQTEDWSFAVEKSKNNSTNSGSKVDKGYVGHKSAKMMQASKNIERRKEEQIAQKKNLLKDIDREDSLIMKPLRFNKRELVIAKDLQIEYNNKKIFKKISFTICVGDRIALTGKNGSGKSSILKLILGEDLKYTGKIQIANEMKISYISQSTDNLKGNLKKYCEDNKIDEAIFKAMLYKLGVKREDFDIDISNMSDGQKKKVLIAKSISESADLYIWDEPLNYIDIISREQIEDMILKYNPTIIFVEHDERFVKKIANKIINIKKEF